VRVLSSELTAAQRADASKPYHSLIFTSRNGATTHTYLTDDTPNRILFARTAEELYGGTLFDVTLPSGQIVPIAAQLWMNNRDDQFTAKDLRGYKVEVGRGFSAYVNGINSTSISSTKISYGQPYVVMVQRDHGVMGKMTTEFLCVDMWGMLGLQKLAGDDISNGTFNFQGGLIREALFRILMKDCSVVTNEQGGAGLVDISTTMAAFPTASDPSTAVCYLTTVGDYILIGVADSELSEFDRVTFLTSTQGTGTSTVVTYEYSRGSGAYGTLSGVTDKTVLAGTRFLTNTRDTDSVEVPRGLAFTHPSDWAANTITLADTSTISRRWIKITVTTQGTGDCTLNRIGVNKHWGMNMVRSDDKENEAVLKPDFEADLDTSRYTLFRQMLDRTQLTCVMTSEFFQFNEIDVSPVSADYRYDINGDHSFITDYRERTLVIPNRIIAMNQVPGGAINQETSDNQDDSTSVAALGPMVEFIVDPTINSVADGNKRAARRLVRYQQEAYQGEVLVPMHIGQEPWDYLDIVDDRITVTFSGRIGRLVNTWDSRDQTFSSSITLGIRKVIDFPTPSRVSSFGPTYIPQLPATQFQGTAGTDRGGAPDDGKTPADVIREYEIQPGSSLNIPERPGSGGYIDYRGIGKVGEDPPGFEQGGLPILEPEIIAGLRPPPAQGVPTGPDPGGIGQPRPGQPVQPILPGAIEQPQPVQPIPPGPPPPPVQPVIPPMAPPAAVARGGTGIGTTPSDVRIIQPPPLAVPAPAILFLPGAGAQPLPPVTPPVAPGPASQFWPYPQAQTEPASQYGALIGSPYYTTMAGAGLRHGQFTPSGGSAHGYQTAEEEKGISDAESTISPFYYPRGGIEKAPYSVFNEIVLNGFRLRQVGYEQVVLRGTNYGGVGQLTFEAVNNTSLGDVKHVWFRNMHTLMLNKVPAGSEGVITFTDENLSSSHWRFATTTGSEIGGSVPGWHLGADRITGAGVNALENIFFKEGNGPIAPVNADAVISTSDNGLGKTDLVVRFKTGLTIVLATEP
jgi:hypothetical protein